MKQTVSRKVSVILAAYNAETTIVRTVDSVLAQTFPDFELIIINDGSNDRTLDLVLKIADPRVRIFSFSRSGVSVARNRGIARANGYYIAFIDADDMWTCHKLEMQVAALESSPGARAAYCWADYIDKDDTRLFPDQRPRFEGDVYKAILTGNFIDSGSTILVQRGALDRINGFAPELACFEDWDLYVRLARTCPFILVPRVLVFYRLHPGTLTTDIALMETNYEKFLGRTFPEDCSPLSTLKIANQANTYAYLTAKATQDLPARKNCTTALCLFAKALRADPWVLVRPGFKPWVVKALAKAVICLILPAPVVKKIAGTMEKR